MIKEYKAAQLTAFTFIEEQVKPKVRMNDMKVGDIFKTEEGKIMMRVSLVNTMFDHVGTSAYEISKRFTVINLQTGTIWQPINQIRNQVVFPQNAVVHISDKV